jgi:hypothetical protein
VIGRGDRLARHRQLLAFQCPSATLAGAHIDGVPSPMYQEQVSNSTRARPIPAVALISSLAFKAAAVTMLGARRLWMKVTLPYLLTIVVGIGIVLLWQ